MTKLTWKYKAYLPKNMIVVFGGAFNPPTVAHFEVIKHLLKQPFINEVMLMPVGDHYEKPGMVSAEHRFNMLQEMVKNLLDVTTSDVEIKAPKALKTVETLEILNGLYPEEEFAFVMGADNLAQLSSWSQHERLVKNYKMIVLNRDQLDVHALIQSQFPAEVDQFIVVSDFAEMAISATDYRENPGKKELLCSGVAKYIEKHGLYR